MKWIEEGKVRRPKRGPMYSSYDLQTNAHERKRETRTGKSPAWPVDGDFAYCHIAWRSPAKRFVDHSVVEDLLDQVVIATRECRGCVLQIKCSVNVLLGHDHHEQIDDVAMNAVAIHGHHSPVHA
jgi:hypothetical protein